jgi:hypothetical protein
MTTVAHHSDVRINAKGDISVPWRVFVNVHPEEVMDIVRKKGRFSPPHTIRPMTRTEGVKQFV